MITTVYGRVQASYVGKGKLVWDVLPARPRAATSLHNKDDSSRQQSAPHAYDIAYLATAASSVSDGLAMSNLATTVSAGLLLLLGVASVSTKKLSEDGAKEVSAAANNANGGSGAPAATSSLNGTAAVAESTQDPNTKTTSTSAAVVSVREWIAAYRTRTASASGSEQASESATESAAPSTWPASAAPASFALPGKLITEAERAATDELAEKAAADGKSKVFVSAAASGKGKSSSATTVSNSSEGGSNPFAQFLAWLKALWDAIVKFFAPNSSSGATA